MTTNTTPTVDAETATRRGRMMSTGEVALSVADFASLLHATAWYPASPAVPITATEFLLHRCWQDLAAVKPELAQHVWTVALNGGAHPSHVISLAELLAAPQQESSTP